MTAKPSPKTPPQRRPRNFTSTQIDIKKIKELKEVKKEQNRCETGAISSETPSQEQEEIGKSLYVKTPKALDARTSPSWPQTHRSRRGTQIRSRPEAAQKHEAGSTQPTRARNRCPRRRRRLRRRRRRGNRHDPETKQSPNHCQSKTHQHKSSPSTSASASPPLLSHFQ